MDFLREMGLDQAIEILTVVLSLLYVGLIAGNRRVGWWFGIAASILSVWLFIRVNLLAESVLSAYYVLMGLYGYFHWKYGSPAATNPPILVRSLRFHGTIIGFSLLLTIGLAQVLNLIGSSNIYADAGTTIFSFIATWMVAKRIIENWIYWICINALTIYLYFSRDLNVYAVLSFVYTILAVYGYFEWKKDLQKQLKTA